jgi:hypothetical protein
MTFTAGPGTVRLLGASAQGNPTLPISATWNNAGVTFTGIQFDVTDTASAAGSLLMDLRVGGTSKLSVSKNGAIIFTGSGASISLGANAFGDTIFLGGSTSINGTLQFPTGGSAIFGRNASFGIFCPSTGQIGFGATSDNTGTNDVALFRDAADTLAQRRGVNAQTFRIYNTFTDASNYERAALEWQSNQLNLRVEGAGTGSNRAFSLVIAGQTVAFFSQTGGRSIVLGNSIATNASSGFLYVPTCAGTPTGAPESYTGRAPIVIDTTNNKLYFYSGGAWRDAGP